MRKKQRMARLVLGDGREIFLPRHDVERILKIQNRRHRIRMFERRVNMIFQKVIHKVLSPNGICGLVIMIVGSLMAFDDQAYGELAFAALTCILIGGVIFFRRDNAFYYD